MAIIVWGLDLGARTGFAYGPAGERPNSGSVLLKQPDEPACIAYANLIAFLAERWSQERPGLIAKERLLPMGAYRDKKGSFAMLRMQFGLHAVVEGMAIRFGLPWRDGADSTIRKHLLGVGRLGSREETKKAVVDRCHVLGLLDRRCHDNDRADAIAVHDWAAMRFTRRSASMLELHLFGEAVQ